MKKLFYFIVLIAFSLNSKAGNDTLRTYDPSDAIKYTYNTTSYPTQIARFDLPYPAVIKGFIVTVDGAIGSTATMQFCGHEGGVALIGLFNNLIPQKTITKLISGIEKIYVPIDSPWVQLDNTQFSLVFKNFNGIRVFTDTTNHEISCSSSSGGDYYYQYGLNSQSNYALLSTKNRAFIIDVILEYPKKVSNNVFKDVTSEAGISTSLPNASIAAADYDNDGFTDLLITGKLYHNNKNATFTDVTGQHSIKNKYSGVSANAFVDIDNDGKLDIILFGGDTSVVFLNKGSTFTESILGLKDFKAFLSFSIADINFDNYPDLFVSQLWQTYPQPEPNYFFYNDGNLNFTDDTKVIYPQYDGTWNWPSRQWDPANNIVERNRNSRGSQWIDFDNDGDLDLFITNYFLQKDEFYRNNGNGTFTDICDSKWIDYNSGGANHGTGVDWYDYDNDGDFDLLLPQFAHPRFIIPYDHRGTTIYRNDGSPSYSFTDMVGQINNYTGAKAPIGLELEETHAGGAWGDVNNDGLVDFLMTVFYGCRYINFYEQQADHTFNMKTFDYGLWNINTGTDLVWLDYDNDGKLDMAGSIGGQFRLFKNNVYNPNSWVELDLKSTSSNKFSIGCRVALYAEGEVYTQEVCAGRGQKMQKPYRLHFGLNQANSLDSVVVLWPSKPQKRETFLGLTINNIYTLTEGGNITVSEKEDLPLNENMVVFPNPSSSQITISNINFKSSCTITIYNSLMQVVYQENVKSNIIDLAIDVKKWNSGVYFVNSTVDGKTETVKIIITH